MSQSIYQKISSMESDKRREFFSNYSASQKAALADMLKKREWRVMARPEQLAPKSDWVNWLIMAGRGFGKTRCLSEWLIQRARKYTRANIIGATADDARDILIEGESGILTCAPNTFRPKYIKNERKLKWPNGSVSLVFTADEPERLRGKQHTGLIMDELAAWRYPDAYTQAMLGLRLGDNPQCVIATTPKPIKLLKEIIDNPKTKLTRGTTYDNAGNLAQQFLNSIISVYEGTRLGKQELSGELLTDTLGALWTRVMIANARISKKPYCYRVIVSVDPAVTANESSNETGIIVCGKYETDSGDNAVVLADYSGVYTPNEWAEKTVYAYALHDADMVIGEVNNGGDLIESVLRNAAPHIHYKGVRAAKGKYTRAEPVAALYEQNKIFHLGEYEKLEQQMTEYVPGISRVSPDRMDALVWGITELMLQDFNIFVG